MRALCHLFLFLALLNGVCAEPPKRRADTPYQILWKQQEFTKAELVAHIDERQKQAAKLKESGSMLMGVPSRLNLKSIIEDYRDGDTIILYDNGLWEKMMGRRGYALVRDGKVVADRLVAMN